MIGQIDKQTEITILFICRFKEVKESSDEPPESGLIDLTGEE